MEDLKDVVEEPNQINPSEEINSEEEIKKTSNSIGRIKRWRRTLWLLNYFWRKPPYRC